MITNRTGTKFSKHELNALAKMCDTITQDSSKAHGLEIGSVVDFPVTSCTFVPAVIARIECDGEWLNLMADKLSNKKTHFVYRVHKDYGFSVYNLHKDGRWVR